MNLPIALRGSGRSCAVLQQVLQKDQESRSTTATAWAPGRLATTYACHKARESKRVLVPLSPKWSPARENVAHLRGSLTPSTVVSRAGGLVESEIDSEVVALNIETGTCYGLNAVGSRIWGLLANPVRISDICAVLISEYQVEAGTCEDDVIELIGQLLAENLVVVKTPT
jgi:hypothetical protein